MSYSLQSIKNFLSSHSHHRHLVEGVMLTLGLRALQLILGLATTYFVVRNLSVGYYGHYSFILTVVGVLTIFSLPGMGQAVSQSAARGFRGTYKKALIYVVGGACLASLLLLGFAIYAGMMGQQDLVLPYVVAAILFPIINGLSLWKSLNLGEEKFRHLFKVGTINSILNSIFIILSAHFFPGNISALLLAFWGVPALQNINQTLRSLKAIHADEKEEAGSIVYGVKNSVYSVLGVISSNIDNVLIFSFLSPVHLAIYAVAQKVPELIKANIQEIGKAMTPKFSKQKSYTQKTEAFFTWFSIVVGGGILIFAFTLYPFFFRLVFGEKYEDAIFYSQMLMVSIAVANAAPLKFWFISSRLDNRTSRDIYLIIGITRIVMSCIFIPLWGIKGAVLSALFHRFVTSTGTNLLIERRYPIVKENSGVKDE